MKPFNMNDWLPGEEPEGPKGKDGKASHPNDIETFERALKALEDAQKDITGDYSQWRNIGFALTHFGEAGREYFHRVSRMYPSYDQRECDRQYQRCLDSKGSGIGLGTFYHYLKEAGINIPASGASSGTSSKGGSGNTPARQLPPPAAGGGGNGGNRNGGRPPAQDDDEEEEPAAEPMPVFPEELYERLPQFLKQVVAPCDGPEEHDIMLLGALTALSSCLTRFYGIYDGREIKPILYLFIAASASAGKGRMNLLRRLVLPIHREKRAQAKGLKDQYEQELAEYMAAKPGENREKPGRPPERMLFIPANSSATGVLQLLSDNQGTGLIFETEGDTLSLMLRQDYGNYSDSFRKNFHHETISYYRRTDREYVDIETPSLAALLSGTPRQVHGLIPSAENGLFSRFLFYYMNFDPGWKKVFEKKRSAGIAEHYDQLGEEFHSFYQKFQAGPGIEVVLSEEQIDRFYGYFARSQTRYISLFREDFAATIRRMGLIFFRICILLTALRLMETGGSAKRLQCSDLDYEVALAMVGILIKHSTFIYNGLPKQPRISGMTSVKEKFLDLLPLEFDRRLYLKLGEGLGIHEKTLDRYIARFLTTGLVVRVRHNDYRLQG